MKRRKIKIEALAGAFLGGACCLVYAFSLFFVLLMIGLFLDINCFNQITFWVMIGPAVIFPLYGQYIFAKNVISEKERKERLSGIKVSILGFLIWLVVMILTYLLNVDFGSSRNMLFIGSVAGFIVMLIIILLFFYMKNDHMARKARKWGL